jgi:hypothetical protein
MLKCGAPANGRSYAWLREVTGGYARENIFYFCTCGAANALPLNADRGVRSEEPAGEALFRFVQICSPLSAILEIFCGEPRGEQDKRWAWDHAVPVGLSARTSTM